MKNALRINLTFLVLGIFFIQMFTFSFSFANSIALDIQCYNSYRNNSSDTIGPCIKFTNTGTTAIDLTKLKLRYYYTIDEIKTQDFVCDYCSIDSSKVTGSFYSMSSPTSTADYYLEIGYTSSAGSLPVGSDISNDVRIYRSDWSSYTQNNDYSFDPSSTSYVSSTKVTAYYNGVLISGTEPTTSTSTSTPTLTPTSTAISTPTSAPTSTPTPASTSGLDIKFYNYNRDTTSVSICPHFLLTNTGTTNIDLNNIKLRYYYNIDADKAQTFQCDWSEIGESNVIGNFYKLDTPVLGADSYVEIGFTSEAGALVPEDSVAVQCSISRYDWTNYDQSNDYSFNEGSTDFTNWTKITAYNNGTLIYGVIPSEDPSLGVSQLDIKSYNYVKDSNTLDINPFFKLTNMGTTDIELKYIKMRYYYTLDANNVNQIFACDMLNYNYTPQDTSVVIGDFYDLEVPTATANKYLEIGFTDTVGKLLPGDFIVMHYRINGTLPDSDSANFNQDNDYSFNKNSSTFNSWNKITLYYKGVHTYGISPNQSTIAATFYENNMYGTEPQGGYVVEAEQGNYTLSMLNQIGISSASLSCVKVNPGYKVILYDGDNFIGESVAIESDTDLVNDVDFNDRTVSLKVETIAKSAFLKINASDYDSSSGTSDTYSIDKYDPEIAVWGRVDQYTCYKNINFGDGVSKAQVEIYTSDNPNDTGVNRRKDCAIELRIDGLSGTLIGSIGTNLPITLNDIYAIMETNVSVSGIHDLYVIYHTNDSGFDVRSFIFRSIYDTTSPTPTPTPAPTPTPYRSAFSNIEAARFDSSSGIASKDAPIDYAVDAYRGYDSNTSSIAIWGKVVQYTSFKNVNFETGAVKAKVKVSTREIGSTGADKNWPCAMELRVGGINGTLIATFKSLPNTSTYTTVDSNVFAAVSGVKDLYVIYHTDSQGFDVNSFSFIKGTATASPESEPTPMATSESKTVTSDGNDIYANQILARTKEALLYIPLYSLNSSIIKNTSINSVSGNTTPYYLKVSYLNNTSLYDNKLGFFTYTGSENTLTYDQITEYSLIFNHIDGNNPIGSSKKIGPFDPNEKVGFFIQTDNRVRYYSIKSLNDDSKDHFSAFTIYNIGDKRLILSAEDSDLSEASGDFDDNVFVISMEPSVAFDFSKYTDIDELRQYSTTNVAITQPNLKITTNGERVNSFDLNIDDGNNRNTLEEYGILLHLKDSGVSASEFYCNKINQSPTSSDGNSLKYVDSSLVPGQQYRVRGYATTKTLAETVYGPEKAFTVPVITLGSGDGLKVNYYSKNDFTQFTSSSVDLKIDSNFQSEYLGGDYSVVWEGKVQPFFSESYTFKVNAADGIRLTIDGNSLINDINRVGSEIERSATITLNASQRYSIKLEFSKKPESPSQGSHVQLYWESATQGKEIVPQMQLYNIIPSDANIVAKSSVLNIDANTNGLRAEYFNGKDCNDLKSTKTVDNINFNWESSAIGEDVDVDNASAIFEGYIVPRYSEEYTFEAYTGDGARLWINDECIIDQYINGTSYKTGKITLDANQAYKIKMQYFDQSSDAKAILYWQSIDQSREIVSKERLFLPGAVFNAKPTSINYESVLPISLISGNPVILSGKIDCKEDVANPVVSIDLNLKISSGSASPFAMLCAEDFLSDDNNVKVYKNDKATLLNSSNIIKSVEGNVLKIQVNSSFSASDKILFEVKGLKFDSVNKMSKEQKMNYYDQEFKLNYNVSQWNRNGVTESFSKFNNAVIGTLEQIIKYKSADILR